MTSWNTDPILLDDPALLDDLMALLDADAFENSLEVDEEGRIRGSPFESDLPSTLDLPPLVIPEMRVPVARSEEALSAMDAPPPPRPAPAAASSEPRLELWDDSASDVQSEPSPQPSRSKAMRGDEPEELMRSPSESSTPAFDQPVDNEPIPSAAEPNPLEADLGGSEARDEPRTEPADAGDSALPQERRMEPAETVHPAPSAALTPYVGAANTVLRRHFDARDLLEAQGKLSSLLNMHGIPLVVFVARAAERCAGELPGTNVVVVAELTDFGIESQFRMKPLESFRKVLLEQSALDDLPADLTVLDLSDLEIDDMVLPLVGRHLILSRIQRDGDVVQGTLTLSGDLPLRVGAAFLKAVSSRLESPITLMV